jgi:transcription antitermination factor NusA-like protein
MSATWKTKWGVRRVRRDTPTIEEALIAAESLANDPGQRAEIAASLMGVPVDDVKALAAKQAARMRGRSSLVTGRTRAVVVEYKRPRIGHGPVSFASKR